MRRIDVVMEWTDETPLEPAGWKFRNCGLNWQYGGNGVEAWNRFYSELFPDEAGALAR